MVEMQEGDFEIISPKVELDLKKAYPAVFPMPEGLPQCQLTENARTVLEKRYVRKQEDGSLGESVEGMFWRVASNVAKAEPDHNRERISYEFYQMLSSRKFFPNSPTFTGAGTALGQLAACFVLPISDDMGRDEAGIFQTLRNAALIQQTGGGNGFSFSRLRHKGALVKTSNGEASGPVGFLKVYDQAFGMVAQGGTRRGANMAVLRVDHPDIRQFVACKADESQITNFNISVGITDAFMRAVKDDTYFDLIAPHTKEVVETVKARELWDHIVLYAHKNGEPGVLFLDAANRSNPVPHLYDLEATNPCGEQWLGPFENCCLGSVNLAMHLGPEGQVDWEGLRKTVQLSTRFLDDVVETNAYVPAVPQLKEAAMRCRRIGLGIMGLADLMYHCRIRYGSEEGQEFAAQVMEWVRYWTMHASMGLAIDRGAFPAIKGSIYDPDGCPRAYPGSQPHDYKGGMIWRPPVPLVPFRRSFGRPAVDWDTLAEDVAHYGIRNAAQTTVAPTGTIATVAGCEGYGCEPVFALAYTRHVNDKGQDLQLQYTSPLFTDALRRSGINNEAVLDRINQRVLRDGSCKDIYEIPSLVRKAFVVSSDVTAEEHVRMQAAIQAFVDNSMSKTCNLPEGATKEDVARAYTMAWELGCKGITVYVTGSRNVVVLETKKEADRKEQAKAEAEDKGKGPALNAPLTGEEGDKVVVFKPPTVEHPAITRTNKPLTTWSQDGDDGAEQLKKEAQMHELPEATPAVIWKEALPGSKNLYTIIGYDPLTNEPTTCFIEGAKGGSDAKAYQEAIGRLTSLMFATPSEVAAAKRLELAACTMRHIGGGSSRGMGDRRVSSMPDAASKSFFRMSEAISAGHLPNAINPLFVKNYEAYLASNPEAASRARFPNVFLEQDQEEGTSEKRGEKKGAARPGRSITCPNCENEYETKGTGCGQCKQCGIKTCS